MTNKDNEPGRLKVEEVDNVISSMVTGLTVTLPDDNNTKLEVDVLLNELNLSVEDVLAGTDVLYTTIAKITDFERLSPSLIPYVDYAVKINSLCECENCKTLRTNYQKYKESKLEEETQNLKPNSYSPWAVK